VNNDILVTTADTLPPALGGDLKVKFMYFAQCSNYASAQAAIDALTEWAAKNGYDALVGVRLVAYPSVTAPVKFGASSVHVGPIATDVLWAAYGTAIGWEDED